MGERKCEDRMMERVKDGKGEDREGQKKNRFEMQGKQKRSRMGWGVCVVQDSEDWPRDLLRQDEGVLAHH